MKTTEAYAIDNDDMHFTVECPTCNYELEYSGYFDSSEVDICSKCKTQFRISKLWLSEDDYIN